MENMRNNFHRPSRFLGRKISDPTHQRWALIFLVNCWHSWNWVVGHAIKQNSVRYAPDNRGGRGGPGGPAAE